jgi:hypothetical protein
VEEGWSLAELKRLDKTSHDRDGQIKTHRLMHPVKELYVPKTNKSNITNPLN